MVIYFLVSKPFAVFSIARHLLFREHSAVISTQARHRKDVGCCFPVKQCQIYLLVTRTTTLLNNKMQLYWEIHEVCQIYAINDNTSRICASLEVDISSIVGMFLAFLQMTTALSTTFATFVETLVTLLPLRPRQC